MTFALAVVRQDATTAMPETELVTVSRRGSQLTVTLDDGSALHFDAWELIGAAAGAGVSSVEAQAA